MKKNRIKKETFERLHNETAIGETHERAISRLIESCEKEKKDLNLSEEIINKLFEFTGINDLDEALNILIDKYKKR